MNHTLTRGLNLLLLLAGTPRPHTLSELAQRMELPKSHVHRLLQTLVKTQYVVQDARRRYAIGVGALRLGHALLRDIPIRRAALPVMLKTVQRVPLPMTLALPFDTQAISVAHVTPDGQVRATSETLGSVLGARTSASGKLFLAHMPAEKQAQTLEALTYSPQGPNAHRSAASLRKDLAAIAQRGYSLNNRETGRNTASLAVPIYNADREVSAALGFSGSAAEFTSDHLPVLLDVLQQAAREIETTWMENAPCPLTQPPQPPAPPAKRKPRRQPRPLTPSTP